MPWVNNLAKYIVFILQVNCVYTPGSISNLYHIETVNYQLCVNYSVHHASFMRPIIVQFYMTGVDDLLSLNFV